MVGLQGIIVLQDLGIGLFLCSCDTCVALLGLWVCYIKVGILVHWYCTSRCLIVDCCMIMLAFAGLISVAVLWIDSCSTRTLLGVLASYVMVCSVWMECFPGGMCPCLRVQHTHTHTL
jgi:hypothetical protein